MFPASYFEDVYQQLVEHGISFDPGLNSAELAEIEERNQVNFPPDLAAFLQHGVPRSRLITVHPMDKPSYQWTNTRFPDWRGNPNVIAEAKAQLIHGLHFKIEHADQWIPEWGDRPSQLQDALNLATELFNKAPVLLPIYGHRLIPSEPLLTGNPVFSIVGTDIIHYGKDLADYLSHEFGVSKPDWCAQEARPIRFWQDIWYSNNAPFMNNQG